jgi:hypothetical protein
VAPGGTEAPAQRCKPVEPVADRRTIELRAAGNEAVGIAALKIGLEAVHPALRSPAVAELSAAKRSVDVGRHLSAGTWGPRR